ncbi:unnamed protein product [Pleuronectes platessa]|uniref:Uncharacterized protein n=1 Tax=Pleuronectes platessa TaxID=8262 RepID=A0A9N7URW3_PLEPL|nr:unnamed protein product [Pleuronectes platessa]
MAHCIPAVPQSAAKPPTCQQSAPGQGDTTEPASSGREMKTRLMIHDDRGHSVSVHISGSERHYHCRRFSLVLCLEQTRPPALLALFISRSRRSLRPVKTQGWKHVVTIIAGLAARCSRPSHLILLQREGCELR